MKTTPELTEEATPGGGSESSTTDTSSTGPTTTDTAASSPQSQEPAATQRVSPRALAATVLAALVVLVLAAATCAVLWPLQQRYDHRQRDDAITVAAREQVLALLTLSPENAQASFDRVLANSTGSWRQEFAQQADQFTQVVRNGQVRSQAMISDSGIQSADDDRATVLVSAQATIHNVESPQGYPGVYRVLLNLQRQNGQWLVSDLQFVP